MNLHLTIDDWPFIDQFIEKTDELGYLKMNKFLVYSSHNLVRNVKSKNIHFAEFDSAPFWRIIGDINSYKAIYFHSLSSFGVELINKCDIKVPIYWIFWGYDAFNYPIFKKNVFLPNTKKTIFKSSNFRELIGKWLLHFRSLKSQKKWVKAVNKITYFCHYIENDYFEIKKITNAYNLEFIDFTYGQLEKFVRIEAPFLPKNQTQELNILLGHSADPILNHMDSLNYLSKLNLNIRITCPLSYPENKVYINKVIEFGHNKFGNKFNPILNILPSEDYNQILESIDLAIFDSNVPIGFGNILNLLYNGKAVLMNEKNSLFHELRKLDLSVYNMNKIETLEIDSHTNFKNRSILQKNFGLIKSNERFKKLLIGQNII